MSVFPVWTKPKVSREIKDITAPELQRVLETELAAPLVVCFGAKWCGPCKVLMERLEAVAWDLPEEAHFVKLDVDEPVNKAFTSSLGISKLPVVLFLGSDMSKPALRAQGLLSTRVVDDILQNKIKHLGGDLRNPIVF